MPRRAGKCFMKHAGAEAPIQDADPGRKAQAMGFRLPTRMPTAAAKPKPKALHDRDAPGALVLNPGQPGAVAVVVDPYICRFCR